MNRDFVENFIRIHKKEIIKVSAGVLVFVMAFVTFCIRNDENDSERLILAPIDGAQMAESVEKEQNESVSIDYKEGDEKQSFEEKDLQNTIYVDVSGAVREPNVYELEDGSRVYNAIAMAGGFLEDADYSNINLAQILKDQDKITVSTKKQLKNDPNIQAITNGNSKAITNAVYASSMEPASGGLININTASSDELQNISGIGPSTAEKIINYRTENGKFNTIEEIMNVSGIGEKTFAKFKSKITV